MGSAGSGWKKATERSGQQESLLSREGKEEGFFYHRFIFRDPC